MISVSLQQTAVLQVTLFASVALRISGLFYAAPLPAARHQKLTVKNKISPTILKLG